MNEHNLLWLKTILANHTYKLMVEDAIHPEQSVLDDMLNTFILIEDYEKCCSVRDFKNSHRED